MAGMRKSIAIYGVVVLVLAIYAIRFSDHRIAWLICLTGSIPIFAAIVGSRTDKP
jgi:hypothetical protein